MVYNRALTTSKKLITVTAIGYQGDDCWLQNLKRKHLPKGFVMH
jgi:hypothetical protein